MNINTVKDHIKEHQLNLVNHKIYDNIKTIDDLKVFMENHVFAVWDFMSLLKGLQINLTCTTNPWTPVDNTKAARFINEIVLEEETDEVKENNVTSHFELYLESMQEIGADTSEIEQFIVDIKNSSDYRETIDNYDIHINLKSFMDFTFDVIESGEVHKIAAAFTFGRENVIPDMFIEIVRKIKLENKSVDSLIYYLERHIEMDGDHHGPMAMNMINTLCENNEVKIKEALDASKLALEKRIKLWDHIYDSIK